MNTYITVWWLFGAMVAILAIMIPIINRYTTKIDKEKVNKEMCLIRHMDLEKSIIEIKEVSRHTKNAVDDISKNLIRVEEQLKK